MKRSPLIARCFILAAVGALVVLASADVVRATVLYVDSSRPNSGSGLSWSEAFKTIQEAVDAAAASDEIWIKQGTYSLTSEISINKSLSLYGGFQGNETVRDQRDWNNYPTIIDGNYSMRCFSISASFIIDGFTIQNGSITGPGGAIYASGTDAKIISNCRLVNNSSTAQGGAIYVESGSNLSVQYSIFHGNTATLSGGSIFSDSGGPKVNSSKFSNNQSLSGSGGSITCSYATIKNSVFIQNTAQISGGAASGPNTFINCTFFNNLAIQGNTYGFTGNSIYATSNQGVPSATNCIFWSTNGSTHPEIAATPSPASVNYSLVPGGFSGTGNLSDPPQFVDALNGDLHLAVDSPGIDDGNNSVSNLPQFDLDGKFRILDGDGDSNAIVDMGAYEYGRYIFINQPNGGDVLFEANNPHLIKWHPGDSGALVKIEISRDSGLNWATLIAQTENDGKYEWNIAPPVSDKCRIRISSIDYPTIFDESDSNFSIGRKLVLSSPLGGEMWLETGSPQSIEWLPGDCIGHYVKIEISRNSGGSWTSIADSTEDDGNYLWTATPPVSRNCRIRISAVNYSEISDESGADFTINLDSDFDGMDDLYEIDQYENLGRDGTGDWDGDGLSDLEEYQNQTNPKSRDTDSDGLPDKYEVDHKAAGLDPLVDDRYADADSDGFCNLREYVSGTDPGVPDSFPSGSIIHVDIANTSGIEDGTSQHPFNSIQEAVSFSSTTIIEEIWVRKGTYGISSSISVDRAVKIFGGFDGTEQSRDERDWENNTTVVDGLGTTECFHASASAVIDGLTITNGKRGVTFSTSLPITPTISNCIFSNNVATNGGAVSIGIQVTLLITNSGFEYNFAYQRGGAIYSWNGNLTVQSCLFAGNTSMQQGGAIFNEGQSLGAIFNIVNSIFDSNSASNQGGAIGSQNAGGNIVSCNFIGNTAQGSNGGGAIFNMASNFMINACDFAFNTTVWGGGAINNSDSPAVIQNCRFIANHADYLGGAIWNWEDQSSSSPKILNCIFSGNSTSGSGGAICNSWSAPNITNCTFYGNEATQTGGAIYNSGRTDYSLSPKITNCILWNDSAPTNPEIGNSDSAPSVTYCDIQGGYSGTGNKNLDPKFDPDLRLLDGSPCLDAGSNSAPDIPANDMDGQPRIIDYDRNGAAVVDMGAFEHTALSYQPHSGTINTETWGPGTHYVTDSATVANNQVLTIEPGAVVKFAPKVQLLVYGTLRALGTVAGPIVFTSRDDDSHGERIVDSDSSPVAGDWYGIYLNGNSANQGIGEFDHCLFRYGGNASGSADANVYFYYSDSGSMVNSASEYSAQHGVRISTCSPQITNSDFSSNSLSGLSASGAGAPTITGNSFTVNGQYGAELNLTSINPVIFGNTGSGNLLSNGLLLSGTVGTSQTWASTPLFPVVLQNSVTVSSNVRLTIEPGSILKFGPSGQLNVNGTLVASGTKDNRVVFTSLKDDAYGGDTNGDGSATLPAPGDWYGIYLYGSSTNQGIGEFDYCLFRYGGNAGGSADANVYFNYSDSGHMNNCTSEYSANQGVRISTCSPQINYSEFSNNSLSGLYVSGAGTPTITGDVFNSNGEYGAYINLTSITPVISGNTGSGNQTNGFVFAGTAGADQTWSSTPFFPIVVLNTVTVSNNVRLTIEPGSILKFAAAGQLTVNGALDVNGNDGNWVVFTSIKDDAYGGDTNADGSATLPAPGDWYGIYLYGSSTNQGIGEFDYSLLRYGGNSTGNADANVYFYQSDSGYMANCISELGAQQGVRIYGNATQISNSTLAKNTLYGLQVSSGSPRIINSIIWDNTAGGITGGTPIVAYSDIQGGYAGEGNINADPMFLNAATGDYRLENCSPAVDAGDPVEILTVDYVPGMLAIAVDQATAVLPGSTVWVTDGVNIEGDVVTSTSLTSVTVANGFANSYTVARRSYLFSSTSDYYGELEPNGGRIDIGAYGGTSEAASPLGCPANLAGADQDVDGSDLYAFMTAFSANNSAADLNNDGVVNAADLAVFANQFGRTDCEACP